MKRSLLALVLAMLAGCQTLNDVGIGGEPRLACYTRDATAVIDDKVVGPKEAHGSVVRRFKDGDALCEPLKKKKLPKEPVPGEKEPLLFG